MTRRVTKEPRALTRPGGLILLAVLALAASALPAGRIDVRAATSCASPTGGPVALPVVLDGPTVSVTLALPTASANEYLCPVGASADDHVLDVSATAAAGSFALCLNGIPDTAAVDNASTFTYARSSAVSGSNAPQRVAMHALADPEYQVQMATVLPGGLSGQLGCRNTADLGLGTPTTFTLHARYHTLAAASPAGGFAFSAGHLPVSSPSTAVPGDGEPSIAIDALHGNRVYVSTPVGVPSGAGCLLNGNTPSGAGCNGVNFWFSTDGGRTFAFCNASLPNGGGDSHVVVDTAGAIYSADLAATNVDVQKLAPISPGVPATPTPGADCGFGNSVPTAVNSDREWLATYLPDPGKGTSAARVDLSYHDFAPDNLPYECVGVNGGQAFGPCVPMVSATSPQVLADATGNTINGNQVFDSAGTIHAVFGTSTLPDNLATVGPLGPSGPIHNLYAANSADGVNFSIAPVFQSTPPGTSGTQTIANIFPAIAVDRSDNLYAAWSQGAAAGGPTAVYMASSTDHGQTWSRPVQVSPPSLTGNVLPWLVAGTDGRVDVAWVGSADSTNATTDANGTWWVYMAQSLDAHDAVPVFSVTPVSPHPVRYGEICTQGLLCSGDDGRILLDFISVAIDSSCDAQIAYGDAGPDTERAGSGLNPYTDVARQTTGPTLCATATAAQAPTSSTPAPAANSLINSAAASPGPGAGAAAAAGLVMAALSARRRRRRS